MDVDKSANASSESKKQLLTKELEKNQPGSPKAVELQRLIRKEEGKPVHPHGEKPEAPTNAIPEKHYPTNPFGESDAT